jgi:uncharacterized protein YdeI (YjbR/CyaY-like superfamily)
VYVITSGMRMSPDNCPELAFADRRALRAWLVAHHASEKGLWVVIYKAHTAQPTVSYAEAVEEALCFGWIDSVMHRIDEDRYAQKISPRSDPRKWSDSNLKRLRRLIPAGLMTPAGMAVVGVPIPDQDSPPREKAPARQKPPLVVPEYLTAAVDASPAAAATWGTLPPSCRREYVDWVSEAKRDETRQRRLRETVARLERGERRS